MSNKSWRGLLAALTQPCARSLASLSGIPIVKQTQRAELPHPFCPPVWGGSVQPWILGKCEGHHLTDYLQAKAGPSRRLGSGECRRTSSKAPAQRRGTAGNHKMVVAVAIAFSCLFSLLDKFYSILIYLPTTIKYHRHLVMHSCWHLLWDNEFYIPVEETANKTDQVLSRNKAEKCGQKGGHLLNLTSSGWPAW